jgi:hypothetical protein
MGFKDKMKKAAKKKTTKSKSKTPVVHRDDLDEAIDKWLSGDKKEKEGKAEKAQAESVMLPEAEEERVKACMDEGTHHSGVKLNDKVTISVQSRYTKISTDSEDEIREIVGDKYDEFFKEKSKVELTAAALADEELLDKLAKAVGDDFDRYFSVSEEIVPTKAFHEQRATSTDVREMFEKLEDEGLVKPYKAAVKRA